MFKDVCLDSVVAMIYAVVIDRGHENIYYSVEFKQHQYITRPIVIPYDKIANCLDIRKQRY